MGGGGQARWSPGSRGSSSRPPLSQQAQQSRSSADQQVGPACLQPLSPQAGPEDRSPSGACPAHPGPPHSLPLAAQAPPACASPAPPGPLPAISPTTSSGAATTASSPDKGDISSLSPSLCAPPLPGRWPAQPPQNPVEDKSNRAPRALLRKPARVLQISPKTAQTHGRRAGAPRAVKRSTAALCADSVSPVWGTSHVGEPGAQRGQEKQDPEGNLRLPCKTLSEQHRC